MRAPEQRSTCCARDTPSHCSGKALPLRNIRLTATAHAPSRQSMARTAMRCAPLLTTVAVAAVAGSRAGQVAFTRAYACSFCFWGLSRWLQPASHRITATGRLRPCSHKYAEMCTTVQVHTCQHKTRALFHIPAVKKWEFPVPDSCSSPSASFVL